MATKVICGVVSLSGYEGEPLACGFPANHGGAHAWASLPTFTHHHDAPWYGLGYFDGWSDHKANRAYGEAMARRHDALVAEDAEVS